jgi:ribonuclease P protein component
MGLDPKWRQQVVETSLPEEGQKEGINYLFLTRNDPNNIEGMSVSAQPKPDCSFSKTERLRSKVKIEELFKRGSSFRSQKFRTILLSQPLDQGRQVLISVPKKLHKSAVSRNRIKRLIREVYRKNRGIINARGQGYLMAIIYLGATMPTHSEVEGQLIKLFKRLSINKD